MKEAKYFKVIECQGTQYEIGRQYGEACKDNILKSIDINFNLLTLGHNTTKEDVIANARKFLPKATEFDPEMIDFLKGEADGAGITFDEAFALRCSIDMSFYYGRIISLCTSFAATGHATQGGKTILGQNVDWLPGFPMDLLKIKHNDGLEQLVLAFGGVGDYILTSAGLGICENLTLPPIKSYKMNIPYGLYLHKAMRQRTIGDALSVLCQVARGIGYYHMASAEGDIVGIESVFDDYNILYPEKDILVHSNHYLTERFKKGDMMFMGGADSYLRVYRIRQLMDKHYGVITPQIMMEVLTDHHNYPNSICRHVDVKKPPFMHSESLASFIMVPEDRVMYIAYGNPCEHEFIEYKL